MLVIKRRRFQESEKSTSLVVRLDVHNELNRQMKHSPLLVRAPRGLCNSNEWQLVTIDGLNANKPVHVNSIKPNTILYVCICELTEMECRRNCDDHSDERIMLTRSVNNRSDAHHTQRHQSWPIHRSSAATAAVATDECRGRSALVSYSTWPVINVKSAHRLWR